MQNGPSVHTPNRQQLWLALASASAPEQQRLLSYLGERADALSAAATFERLSWYMEHQPVRIRMAHTAHTANDPLPALMDFSDDERARGLPSQLLQSPPQPPLLRRRALAVISCTTVSSVAARSVAPGRPHGDKG